MPKDIVISVDMMGGEHAPDDVIDAIAECCRLNHNVTFLMYGHERITPLVSSCCIPSNRYKFIPVPKIILDDDRPVDALRNSIGSSMREAIEAVQQKKADAVISCGNTGALMVIAKIVLGCMKDIKRPAIVGRMPTPNGYCVMLDLGANVDCTKSHLFQFALMGSCFARAILGIANPSVGILNIGSEDIKGRLLEQQTAEMLRNEQCIRFIGYVEGNDIMSGKADVVVTDGFVGNIALKMAEGTARLFLTLLKQATNTSLFAKIGGILLKTPLKKALTYMEPSNYNGAMLIGLDGIVIKSHGSSKMPDIINAISVACDLARHDINTKITQEMRLMCANTPQNGIERIVDKISEYLHIKDD